MSVGHGHVNHVDDVVAVVLLEGLGLEVGTSLGLESEVLAAELGVGLQFVAELTEAAARVVTYLIGGVNAASGNLAVGDGLGDGNDLVVGNLVSDGVVTVAYAVDAVAGDELVSSRAVQLALLSDLDYRLLGVVSEVGDNHLTRVLLVGGVVQHADLDRRVALALLRVGVTECCAVLKIEIDSPVAFGLHLEGHFIADVVQRLQVGAVIQQTHGLCVDLFLLNRVVLT